MTRNALLLLFMSAASVRAEGALTASSGVPCPLKHSSVHGEVSGSVARVSVTQEFVNSSKEKIEAVYTFPLPPNSAVDDMRMLVGSREVRGLIKRREEAQAAYEAARAAGHVAALLDQERPNTFTQSVANIMPGEQVKITISYVGTVPYDSGWYEFRFPMVVGPRYVPGAVTGRQGGGWSSDTDRVPDASRITPQVAPKGSRAGHDISLELTLDSGVALKQLSSPTHEVDIVRSGASQANVRLRDLATIPNKDFILRYEVAGQHIEDALLTHTSSKGGFFTLLLQPPERVTVRDVTPKELVFVLDTSGSMMGFPIEKAKETLRLGLEGLYPQDTFNLIAVEEMTITDNGTPRRIEVPVEMPEGVSHEGVFGAQAESRSKQFVAPMRVDAMKRAPSAMAPYVDSISVLPEQGRRTKMDPAVEHATAQSKFVRNGKAEIQVWLKNTSPATLEKLKKLGFELVLQPTTAKLVIGRIEVSKLRALSQLDEVRFMAPSSPGDRGGA